ncbi:3968_t:CDS:2, partial [Dentiscutata erythropus]
MSSDQIKQWLEFADVVLNDNTSATNRYEMALSLFLVQIKEATRGSALQVIFTDADPALIAAIHDEFLTTNALNCMFHIAQNIPLNLKNYLKDNYDEFIRDFFEVQQINFVIIFEYRRILSIACLLPNSPIYQSKKLEFTMSSYSSEYSFVLSSFEDTQISIRKKQPKKRRISEYLEEFSTLETFKFCDK